MSGIALSTLMLSVAPAQSQQPSLFERIPEIDYRDVNEVDALSGTLRFSRALLSIGDNKRPLTLGMLITSPAKEYPNFATFSCGGLCFPLPLGQHIAMSLDALVSLADDDDLGDLLWSTYGNTRAVSLPHQSARFSFRTASPFQSTIPDGSQLVQNGEQCCASGFSYTGRDGTQAFIDTAKISGVSGINSHYLVSEITYPDGEKWTYRYNIVSYPSSSEKLSRVKSIVSSKGYGIQFSYASNSLSDPRSHADRDLWMSVVMATAYNKAQVFCDETLLADCSSVSVLPLSVQFIYDRPNGKVDMVVPGRGTTRLHFARDPSYGYLDLQKIENLDVPGSARTIAYYHNEDSSETRHSVTSVTVAGATWGYGQSMPQLPGPPYTGPYDTFYTGMTIWDPLNQTVGITGNLEARRVSHVTIGNNVTERTFNSYRSPTSVTLPEGNQLSVSYDARNNPISVTETAKPGSPLQPRVTRAGYPESCTSLKICNQPAWTMDAKGNVTDYTYSADHGRVVSATDPADASGVRPQKRYEYEQRYAWLANSGGGYTQSTAPIWLLARTRFCKTTAASGSSCVGGASDEVITQYDYGPNSGPNTLLLRGITMTADGQTLRTCYSYDVNGNKISETQPNAALTQCP